MKITKLIVLFPFLIFSLTAFAKIIVVPKKGGQWYYQNGNKFPAQPGDTVMMEPDYLYIGIEDLHGLPDKPIVFIGVTQKTKVGYITTGNSMITQRCSYLVFINIEVGNATDGKFNEQSWNIQSSHNLTIKNFVLKNSKIGFFTNPATGHYPNLVFKNGLIRNISDSAKKGFCEAFYIGRTSGQTLSINSFPNVLIENVDMFDIGGDGVQICNGVNVIVRNCRVIRGGFHKVNDQWNAYLNGGGTSGLWENNYAEDCSGTPFQTLGTGNVVWKNNVSVRSGFGASNQDIFYIRQSFPTLKLGLYGNTADSKSRNWVTNASGVSIDSAGNKFGEPVPPIPPQPIKVDSVTKSSYDSLQVLYKAALQSLSTCNIQYTQQLEEITRLKAEKEELERWKVETMNFVNRKP